MVVKRKSLDPGWWVYELWRLGVIARLYRVGKGGKQDGICRTVQLPQRKDRKSSR